jgi:hypothetical protein
MQKYTGNNLLQRLQSGQKQPKMAEAAKKWPNGDFAGPVASYCMDIFA